MKVRRLNAAGLTAMGQFLDALTTAAPAELPASLLDDPAASEALTVDIEVEARPFANRFEAAQYLDERLTNTGVSNLDRDKGLWAWLALFYFEQLCPVKKGGRRKPGERARWIPEVDVARRFYRHLLLGPYLLRRAHADDPHRAMGLLADPVSVSTSEVYRLLIENARLVTCTAPAAAVTRLYYDEGTGRLRRGAGGKGPGGCRRLLQVLQQLDCTFDIPVLHVDNLMQLLPGEFDRFWQPSLFKRDFT